MESLTDRVDPAVHRTLRSSRRWAGRLVYPWDMPPGTLSGPLSGVGSPTVPLGTSLDEEEDEDDDEDGGGVGARRGDC